MSPNEYRCDLTFKIIQSTPDRVVGEMPLQAGMLNPFGTAHAGAMLWFADVCATHLAFAGQDMAPGVAGFPLAISLGSL